MAGVKKHLHICNSLGICQTDQSTDFYRGNYPQADEGSSGPEGMGVGHLPTNSDQDHCQSGIEEGRPRHLGADRHVLLLSQAERENSPHIGCWDVYEASSQMVAEPNQLLTCTTRKVRCSFTRLDAVCVVQPIATQGTWCVSQCSWY